MIKNLKHVQSKVYKLSIFELTELINQLRENIDLVANELNDKYKSHRIHIESEYRVFINSNLEFMKSIK